MIPKEIKVVKERFNAIIVRDNTNIVSVNFLKDGKENEKRL